MNIPLIQSRGIIKFNSLLISIFIYKSRFFLYTFARVKNMLILQQKFNHLF